MIVDQDMSYISAPVTISQQRVSYLLEYLFALREASYDTCKMSHSAQKQVHPTRNRKPIIHWSITMEFEIEDGSESFMLRSFGPLKMPMEIAPPTQLIVPNTLAMVLKLFRFTFSNLLK